MFLFRKNCKALGRTCHNHSCDDCQGCYATLHKSDCKICNVVLHIAANSAPGNSRQTSPSQAGNLRPQRQHQRRPATVELHYHAAVLKPALHPVAPHGCDRASAMLGVEDAPVLAELAKVDQVRSAALVVRRVVADFPTGSTMGALPRVYAVVVFGS